MSNVVTFQVQSRLAVRDHGEATRATTCGAALAPRPKLGRSPSHLADATSASDRLSCRSWVSRGQDLLSHSAPSASGRKYCGNRSLLAAIATAAETSASEPVVELKSEVGASYAELEQMLKDQDFKAADQETRDKLIELAGEDAVARGWVYFTEVKSIPVADLQTIDNLWKAYSKNKFGYSIQKRLWKNLKMNWRDFFRTVDWTTGPNAAYRSWANNEYIYTMDAKTGHLPLTSCLRGTQLFQGLLEHEAFQPQKKK